MTNVCRTCQHSAKTMSTVCCKKHKIGNVIRESCTDYSSKNSEILASIISTCLHIEAEREKLTHKHITDTAIALRFALVNLYQVNDKEWEEILRGIAKYADCLI